MWDQAPSGNNWPCHPSLLCYQYHSYQDLVKPNHPRSTACSAGYYAVGIAFAALTVSAAVIVLEWCCLSPNYLIGATCRSIDLLGQGQVGKGGWDQGLHRRSS